MVRAWSPVPSLSTLMTSAPRSASSSPAVGPATMWLSSTTLMLASGSTELAAQRFGRGLVDRFPADHHAVILLRRLFRHQPFDDVPEHSLGLALERVPPAAAGAGVDDHFAVRGHRVAAQV